MRSCCNSLSSSVISYEKKTTKMFYLIATKKTRIVATQLWVRKRGEGIKLINKQKSGQV